MLPTTCAILFFPKQIKNIVPEQWQILRRQPGSALFIVLYKTIIQLLRMLWPLLLLWFMRKPGNEAKIDPWEIGVGAISIGVFLLSILTFYTFRFCIQGEDLVVKKGVLVRRQIIMPLHRIQAVHVEENWLHQLLDLAQISLDSPGTEETEVRITLRKRDAESFRQYIVGHARVKQESEASESNIKPKEEILFQLSTPDLFKLGLSANHLEAFFIMLAFGFSTLDNLERAINVEFSGVMRWLSDNAASSTAAALLFVAIAILMLSMVISIIRIVLQYGRFVFSEVDKGYRIQSGLINLKEKLIPFRKVQYISWKANWLRSKLPIFMLHFHVIGDENMRRKWTIKIPITQPEFVDKLLTYYHPQLDAAADYLRVHPKYIVRRVLLAGLLPAALFFTIGYLNFGWMALWLLLLPIYTLIAAWLFQRKFRLYTDADALQVHRGVFGKEYIVLRWENIQSVAIRQGIYQRRHGLATLRLYTADKFISIPFILVADAEQLRDYAIAKIESGK